MFDLDSEELENCEPILGVGLDGLNRTPVGQPEKGDIIPITLTPTPFKIPMEYAGKIFCPELVLAVYLGIPEILRGVSYFSAKILRKTGSYDC